MGSSADTWNWSLDNFDFFSVSSLRLYLDVSMLRDGMLQTHWYKYLPIKMNVFMWCVMLNSFPTNTNLDLKGVDVESILCLVCGDHQEDLIHLFFKCDIVLRLWSRVGMWLEEAVRRFNI